MNQKTIRSLILVLGLFTALVHLIVLNVSFVQETGAPDLLFTLNGLGYLALLAAYFANPAIVRSRRALLHYAFIAYTVVTILAWVAMGDKAWWLGWLTVLDEAALAVALGLSLRLEKAA